MEKTTDPPQVTDKLYHIKLYQVTDKLYHIKLYQVHNFIFSFNIYRILGVQSSHIVLLLYYMLVKLNLFDRSIDRIKMSFSKDTGEMKSNESIFTMFILMLKF